MLFYIIVVLKLDVMKYYSGLTYFIEFRKSYLVRELDGVME